MVVSLEALSPSERAWIIADEARWRLAHTIAEQNPGLDVGGIYHALRNLEKTPTERLRDGLMHGKLFRADRR